MKIMSKVVLCALVMQVAGVLIVGDNAEARSAARKATNNRRTNTRASVRRNPPRTTPVAVDTSSAETTTTTTTNEKTPQEKCAEASSFGWQWNASYNACIHPFTITRRNSSSADGTPYVHSSGDGAFFRYECPADAVYCSMVSSASLSTMATSLSDSLQPCEAMVYQGATAGSTTPYLPVGKQMITGCTVQQTVARAAGDGEGSSSSSSDKKDRGKAAGFGALAGFGGGAGIAVAKELLSGKRDAKNIIANAALSGATGAAVGAGTGALSGNTLAGVIAGVGAGGIMGASNLSNKAVGGLSNLFGGKKAAASDVASAPIADTGTTTTTTQTKTYAPKILSDNTRMWDYEDLPPHAILAHHHDLCKYSDADYAKTKREGGNALYTMRTNDMMDIGVINSYDKMKHSIGGRTYVYYLKQIAMSNTLFCWVLDDY